MHMRLCRRARAIGMTLAIIRTIADDGADDSLRRYREPPRMRCAEVCSASLSCRGGQDRFFGLLASIAQRSRSAGAQATTLVQCRHTFYVCVFWMRCPCARVCVRASLAYICMYNTHYKAHTHHGDPPETLACAHLQMDYRIDCYYLYCVHTRAHECAGFLLFFC